MTAESPLIAPTMSPDDSRLICRWPQLGPTVVRRLEEVGLHSIAAVLEVGVDEAIDRVCQRQGSSAFRNRARSLKAFLEVRLATPCPTSPGSQEH